MNRRLLSLLYQDNPDSDPTRLGSVRRELSARRLTEKIMTRDGSMRSLSTADDAAGGTANASSATGAASAAPPSGGSGMGMPKGLPGFLRRSLRNTYDDDALNEAEASGAADDETQNNLDNTAGTYYPSDQVLQQSSPNNGIYQDNSNNNNSMNQINSRMTNLSVSNSNSSPSSMRPSTSTESLEKQSKQLGGVGNTNNDSKGEKSYKVLTFEKCITSNIVDLRDLRRLGWNGIPVSTIYLTN